MKYFFLFLFAFTLAYCLDAQKITGYVYDSTSMEILEFVNIQNTSTYSGTISNEEGYFEISIDSPTTLRFSFLGYNPKEIEVSPNDYAIPLKIYLSSQSLLFDEVVLEAERSNLGKQIVQKVIKNKSNRKLDLSYSCDVYQQTTMIRMYKESEKDSIGPDSFKVQYLNELASTVYVDGNKYKKIIKAEIKQTGDKQLERWAPMSGDRDFKGSNQFTKYNPIEYFVNPEDFEIDMYENAFQNQTVSDRPLTSPIANTALLNYSYRLKKIDLIDQDSIFTIEVKPIFKGSPAWTGLIYVHSDGYYLTKVELDYNPGINGFKDFNLLLLYNKVEGNLIATEKRIKYIASVGNKEFAVKTSYRTSGFDFEPQYTKQFFSSEQVKYTEEALKPNADLMLQYRGVALEKDLKVFFNEQDSIYRSITSDEYLREQDSIFNKITWRKILLEGFGYRKRSKGLTYSFSSILNSFQLFGVDGFRISPSGGFEKEFINSDILDIGYGLSYGLTNNDIKGRLNVGYTFLPQKFARFYIGGGDVFDFITVYQSLDAIISRSNFINHRYVNGGYSMELVNGLYFNSKIEYSDKQSVANINTNSFSEFLFGKRESALDFERYRIFSLDVDLIYRFGQKYVTRGRKKIILPNNQPSIKLRYRKGIPGIADSEVNFDYLELKWNHKLPSMKIGSLNYQVRAGSFVNKASLRTLEYNFFRGSTNWIFTNPLQDLQQIGQTRSTPNAFLQAGAIHHFDGFFLDKVPLINKLQMEMLAGAGSLIIPDINLYHAEVYIGLGKKFKIWGETMQIAGYAVSSANTINKASIEYKFGLNFYNAFAREWLY